MFKDNIYVIAAGALSACIKINYLGHEISIAAEAIGNMSILTRTSIRVYRGDKDVTEEFDISGIDVTLDAIMGIKHQIDSSGTYNPNYKYHFLKDPDIIVSALDFKLERGDIWAIDTIHSKPVSVSKISISRFNTDNNQYIDARGDKHYISDLFWEEKCIALNETKAHIVLRHLQKMFDADHVWQEIAKKRKQRRDLELAS